MVSETLRLRILQKYERLSRAERRVADTVLLLGDGLVDRTIGGLAREAGVSEPTVVRFCHSAGFGGMKELRRAAMKAAPEVSTTKTPSDLGDVDSDAAVVAFVLGHMNDVLRDTRETLDVRAVCDAVTLLDRARSVRIAALGGSAIAARHTEHYLRRLGIPCTSVAVFDPRDVSVERYDPGDVLVAISRSGDNPLIVDIVSDAKGKGASIVCITSWGGNRLHELADVSLQTPAGGPGLLDDHHALERTAQIAAVNVLLAGLHARRRTSS